MRQDVAELVRELVLVLDRIDRDEVEELEGGPVYDLLHARGAEPVENPLLYQLQGLSCLALIGFRILKSLEPGT